MISEDKLVLPCAFQPKDSMEIGHTFSQKGVAIQVNEHSREKYAEVLLSKASIEALHKFLDDKLRHWDEEG